jgi:hypothetical protein
MRLLFVAASWLLSAGCWFRAETLGLACTEDEQCNPDQRCDDSSGQGICVEADETGSSGTADGGECSDADAFACAAELVLGEPVEGLLDELGEGDYWAVTLPGPGVLEIAVDPVPAEIDADVYVYDAGEIEVGNATGSSPGQGAYLDLLRPAGPAYVAIFDGYGDAQTDSPYELLVTLDETDTFELNNSFGQAAPIELDQEVVAKIRPRGDVDYFRLEVPAGGVLDLAVDPVPAALDLDLWAYQGMQQQIAGRTDSVPGQGVFLSVLVDQGTYYLAIEDSWHDAQSADPYTLVASLDTSDPYEPNGVLSDAAPIPFSQELTAKIRPVGDLDHYRFDVALAGMLTVDISSVPAGIQAVLTLYDDQQTPIGSKTGADGQAVSEVFAVEPGTHYLRIEDQWGNGESTEAYGFGVSAG